MKKRRAALVLAGGGARGVAHIGAIEELESQGFEVHAVAGTSMGALVGGMYASGHLEAFKEWMYTLDKYKVFGLVDFALSTEGLVKGDRVMRAMKELVPDVKIEKMPLPFAAVAADLLTGREVVLDRGGLYDAIRASISIPSVFRPVRRGNQVLVDGGTVNPLPLNRVRREPGDVLVAVDVSAPFSEEMAVRSKASLNYYKVITASSEIMQQHIARLMCKIYKEGYYIRWDEEQCLIFANKAGREVQAEEVQGIIEILFTKGILDRNSYQENGILTSESIQKVWMEATKRRKRELSELPYLMVKPEKENGKADTPPALQEIQQPELFKKEKTPVNPKNVVHHVVVDAKNACNSGQSKVKEKKAEENKEFPPSAPPKGEEEERKGDSAYLPIPGYAFNTMTHNYSGLMDTLKRLSITDTGEVNSILRLSDYGRKGTTVWKLIANTCWSDIGAKGRYLIAALNKTKRR